MTKEGTEMYDEDDAHRKITCDLLGNILSGKLKNIPKPYMPKIILDYRIQTPKREDLEAEVRIDVCFAFSTTQYQIKFLGKGRNQNVRIKTSTMSLSDIVADCQERFEMWIDGVEYMERAYLTSPHNPIVAMDEID